MLEMAKKDILPAVISFTKELAETLNAKKSLSLNISCVAEEELLKRVSSLSEKLYCGIQSLEKAVADAKNITDTKKLALYYKDNVLCAMNELRDSADTLETIVGEKYWPFPSYGKLLFSVN